MKRSRHTTLSLPYLGHWPNLLALRLKKGIDATYFTLFFNRFPLRPSLVQVSG